MTIKEAEANIKRMGTYYIVSCPERLPNHIDTLIEFVRWYVNIGRSFETKRAKSHTHQCYGGSFRSAGDITRIARHYFPKATLVEVRDELLRLAKAKQISSNICYDIKKRVFMSGPGTLNEGILDEFGWTFTHFLNENNAKKKSPVSRPGTKQNSKGRSLLHNRS